MASVSRSLRRAHEDVALPAVIHQTVQIPATTRIVIVGDIHGCFDELCELLQKVGFDAERDRLISVGDLVNKGPKSCEVVRFAREQRVLCVRGNHDDAALSNYYAWQRQEDALPAKYDYVRSFSPEDVAFLEQLPFTISLPSQNAIVVHAGLVPGTPLEEQEPINMYKMRWITRANGATPGEWSATETLPAPTGEDASASVEVQPWATQWSGPAHVIFGHDAKRGLQREPFATGLDTGCCYGRQLTACLLPTREIVSVAAHAAHAPMTGATPLQPAT